MRAIDPSTGSVVLEVADHDASEVERRVAAATTAFGIWRRRSISERAEPMKRLAALFRERRGELAVTMAGEMGKPVTEGRREADKSATGCEYFVDQAAAFLSDEPSQPVLSTAGRSYVAFEPLGPILAIMPWNFPVWQVIRFAAPALMAGNVALVKHAPGVPGCALALETLFRDAGFPEGVLSFLFVDEGRVPALIDDPRVAAVTLTGSPRAGRAVAAQAGRALKKAVLELGGSDPYVVLADADLDIAVSVCVTARMFNGGQSCVAAKRFIVVQPLVAEFERRMAERMNRVRMGDPMEDTTELGPMARLDLRDALHRQVTESVARGARLLTGGVLPDRPGAWYPPTVLTNVLPGMPAFDQETFGPVAAITAAKDETEAIRLANTTSYGLGACVFTRDLARGEAIARTELAAGSCFVNAQVRSDPALPFGGIKESGYGRELGRVGIQEFVNAKTVWVA